MNLSREHLLSDVEGVQYAKGGQYFLKLSSVVTRVFSRMYRIVERYLKTKYADTTIARKELDGVFLGANRH